MFGYLFPVRGGWPFAWGGGGGGKVILKILIGYRNSISDNGALPGESFR